jgi:signal transduction histidine kinase
VTSSPASDRAERPTVPPPVLERWQTIVDTLAELVEVPAGLIMRVDGDQIEVFVSSRGPSNPYHVGETEIWLASGLYCETVINSGGRLLVADALADPLWRDNPDVGRSMISYLGVPIRWPDHQPFGTICVLDSRSNSYSPLYERLMEQFRDVVEHHLDLIWRYADAQALGQTQAAALSTTEDRLRGLEEAMTRLSRSSALGQFAGAVVHEMAQPLAALGTSAASCRRWLDCEPPDVEAARRAVRRLADANRRADDVMGGLRAMAQNTVHRQPLDVEEMIRDVLLIAKDDLGRTRVRPHLRLDVACRSAFGDRLQLQLVLHNLVRNAVDALREVSDRDRDLVISSMPGANGAYVLVVEDNGAGIAPEVVGDIFDAAFTTKAAGKGLGLAICRSILEAHGGTISAGARRDGPGARFTLTLPPR